MEHDEKRTLVPMVNIFHDKEDMGLNIEVDLAGVSKDSIDLKMDMRGFCVKAEGEDFMYENCYMLAHEIKPTDTTAKFNSGLLKIHAPFKEVKQVFNVSVQ